MSREQVLGRIRAALDHDGSRSARTASTADRLARPLEHPLPARARRPASELVQQFVAIQSGLGVDLIEVGSAADIPRGHCRLSVGAGIALPAAPRKRSVPCSAAVADESAACRRYRRGAGRRHGRPVTRRRRRRRDGHAGAGLRRGQSGDARLPAGHAHCGAARRHDRRQLRGGVRAGAGCSRWLPCRARSTSSPGPRAPATSAARSSMGAHGPRRLAVVLLGND